MRAFGSKFFSLLFLLILFFDNSSQASFGKENGFDELKSIVSSEPAKDSKTNIHVEGDRRAANQDMLVSEDVAVEIEQNLLPKWESAWRSRDVVAFQKLQAANVEFFGWKEVEAVRSGSAPQHFQYFNLVSDKSAAGSNFVSKYLKGFTKFDDVEFQIIEIHARDNKNAKLSKVDFDTSHLKVRFDVRGVDVNGVLKNDRGVLKVTVSRVDGNWLVNRFELFSGDSVKAKNRFFVDATSSSGLANVPKYLRREAIRRGGYALAVADYNKDGISDVLVGTKKETILYQGKIGGKFQRSKSAAIIQELGVKSAIFTDFNNDGWPDLVLTKFDPSAEHFVSIYKNRNGKFVKEKFDSKTNPLYWPMPATVGDFNGDGHIDLYVGFPGVQDFTNLKVKLTEAETENWLPHGLFINNANGGLLEARSDAFGEIKGRDDYTYPHSAIAMDLNGDRLQDLIVMDDRGGLSPFFMNLGDGKFREMTTQSGLSNSGYGMGTAVADFNLDGLTDVVMTNVDFSAALRITNGSIQSKAAGVENFDRGLVYFQNVGNGKFERKTEESNLNWPGLGAAGAESFDYDNDGWPDLYVANGLWSGSSRHNDLSSYFVRGTALRLNSSRSAVDYSGSPYMDILVHHRGKEKSVNRLSMAGYQRNRLFHNNRDGTFTEIGYLAGLDSIADGYVIAKANLQKNGKMDLILRNGDPGTKEYSYPIVQVFLNKTPVSNNSLLVTLEGVDSNRDAIGSKVVAKVGNQKIVQELLANNGCAQSERVVHIGMGSAKQIDSLEVQWPSGNTTVLSDLKPGNLHIKETARTRGPIGLRNSPAKMTP